MHSGTNAFKPSPCLLGRKHGQVGKISVLNKSPPKKESVKETLKDFCRVTSGHGFGRIVDQDESSTVRLIWFLIISFLLGALAVAISIVTYESFIVRGLRTELIIAKNETMDLPDIHICETMLLNKEKLARLGFNNTMVSYLMLSLSPTLASSTIKKDHHRQQLLKEEFDRLTHNISIHEIFETGTIKCHDLLLGCIWRTVRYSSADCCNHFFGNKVEVSALAGACISTQITMNENFYSQVFGFTVFTKAMCANRIEYDTSILTPTIATKKGIVYAVSNKLSRVDAVIPSYGHYAAPGTWTAVEVFLTRTDNTALLSSSLSPRTCVPQGSKKYLHLVPGFESYSQDNCITAGMQKVIQNKFNCSMFFFHRKRKYEICHPSVMINAYNDEVLESMKEYFLTHCTEDCVVDVYSITTSSTELHIGHEHDDMHTDEPHDPSTKHGAIHFFYPSFTYQVIKNHPESLVKWLTDVGGNMSLFLGASLVTLLEVVFLLFRCCKPRRHFIRVATIQNVRF